MKSIFGVAVFGLSLLSVNSQAQTLKDPNLPNLGDLFRRGPNHQDGRDRDGRDRDRRDHSHGESLLKMIGADIETPETGSTIDVLKTVGADRDLRMVRSLIFIAKSRSMRDVRIDVLVNGEFRDTTRVSRSYESTQTSINLRPGRELKSLELRADGAASIAEIALAVEGDDFDQGGGGNEFTIEQKIAGIRVSGTSSTDSNKALQDYTARCNDWKAEQSARIGNRIRYISCGSLNSTGDYMSSKFESVGKLIMLVRAEPVVVEQKIAGNYVRGTSSTDANTALTDYSKRCEEFKASASSDSNRVVYISCGTLTGAGDYMGSKYTSTGKILLDSRLQTTTMNDRIRGIYVRGTSSTDQSQALADYEQRCAQWKEDLQRFNRERILVLSCGTLETTGDYMGSRYESDGVAIMTR